MARLLTLLTMLALLVGTAGAPVPAQAPAPAPAYYFPVQKGARWVWVYLWGEGKKDAEVVEVVMAVEPGEGGAKVVTVGRLHEDGKNWPTEKFEVSARGLMRTADLVVGYPGTLHFQVKLPHRDGQTWAINPNDRTGTRLRARGPERVTVPAGAYDCIRVEYLQNDPTPTQTRWYARGVGMVKLKSGDLQVVLKSFTPGEERAR
jgi:hypothetical protein